MDGLLELFKGFHAETQEQYGIPMDTETLRERITQVITDHVGWVAESKGRIVGVLGGVVTSMMFDKHTKAFIETAWYVAPEARRYGLRMMKVAEEYCLNFKIDRMIIGHMDVEDREKYEKVYARKGFKLFEQHYIKELKYADR